MSQQDSAKCSKRKDCCDAARLVAQLISVAKILSVQNTWSWLFSALLILTVHSPAWADAACSGGADSQARPIAAALLPYAAAFNPNGRFEVTMQSSGPQTADIHVRHLMGSKELFRATTRLQGPPDTVAMGRLHASDGPGFTLQMVAGGSGYTEICTYGFRFQHGAVSYRTLAARSETRGGRGFAGEVTEWKTVSNQSQLPALEDHRARGDAMKKGAHDAMPSTGSRWQTINVGQSANGIVFKRVGNDAISFFDNMPVARCLAGSNFQGERREFLKGEFEQAEVRISPRSPTGRYFAVFCASKDNPALSVHLIDLKQNSIFAPAPRSLFEVLYSWISFSPDDRYALLNQSGDEGDYAPLVLDLSTRRAAKISAPLFPHEGRSQTEWLNEKTVKYRANSCDDNFETCKSIGEYEYEVDVSSKKVKRKRIGNGRE